MVHRGKPDGSSDYYSGSEGLPSKEGPRLVSTSSSLSGFPFHIRSPYAPPSGEVDFSIVICTLDRPESLNVTLQSLSHQTFKSFEVIIITEKGNLSELRDRGLYSSKAKYTVFIDDDVLCTPTWLEEIYKTFRSNNRIVGVTGPTEITDEYKENRDSIRYSSIRRLHDWLFLDGPSRKPSGLSHRGTPSLYSNSPGCTYRGQADYLEACNMAVRTKDAQNVGGFDHAYKKTSEWCEVDLALKIQSQGELFFEPKAKLYHRPSKAGVYKARLSTDHRWKNFMYFQKKWEGKYVKKGVVTYLYRLFVWTYLKMKNLKMI